MATKSSAKDLAAQIFKINQGTASTVMPPTYKPDPRYGNASDSAYDVLNRGRDAGMTAAALRQLANVMEADPKAFLLPEHINPATLRAAADNLDMIMQAQADHDAVGIELTRLGRLDRDVAASLSGEALGLVKASTRNNPELAARVNLLIDLNKRR